MKKLLIILAVILGVGWVLYAIFYMNILGKIDHVLFQCGGRIVCHTTRNYPPNCDENGEKFFLKKNKDVFYMGNIIPDNAYYYLISTEQQDVPGYGAISPIEVADYGEINLEDFVGKTVCIEGKYRYSLPTFLLPIEDLPVGLSEHKQVVADIKEIRLVE